MPQGGHMLWVCFRQPLVWERVAVALAGSALHAVPGEQFCLQGRYPQYLALMWPGGLPDDLRQAVERLARALEQGCRRRARLSH